MCMHTGCPNGGRALDEKESKDHKSALGIYKKKGWTPLPLPICGQCKELWKQGKELKLRGGRKMKKSARQQEKLNVQEEQPATQPNSPAGSTQTTASEVSSESQPQLVQGMPLDQGMQQQQGMPLQQMSVAPWQQAPWAGGIPPPPNTPPVHRPTGNQTGTVGQMAGGQPPSSTSIAANDQAEILRAMYEDQKQMQQEQARLQRQLAEVLEQRDDDDSEWQEVSRKARERRSTALRKPE